MKKSIPKLEVLSDSLNSHMTYYKFNKIDIHLSNNYRKGRINAAKWLNDLVFYYIQKEANLIEEFKEHIQKQKKELSSLDETEFKQGLFDELNIVEEIISK
ncbi:hypothetical protein [Halarcobacter sp.]|uniref:hypothetical protein n=1 Tax=Halarcobacter sp. TaxID=2321133 RepID=UPI002AA68A31|nr:hypothetical protein [Halarcobacter sp.]